MKVDKNSLLLYVVTDRSWLGENLLEAQVEEIIQAGASLIQLREKELSFNEFVRVGKKIKEITGENKIPFIINDNIEVALALDADGVHVGQSDMNARNVRALIGEDKILGVSVRTVEQALLAIEHGADYLGVGAVFSTSTKNDAEDVAFETLRAICDAVSIPVVAIGGINEKNIMELKGTGIDGVAVVSAIFAKPDVGAATRELLARAKEMVGVNKKGFIFDLDGTLLDSMTVWDNLAEEYLSGKGVQNIPLNLKEILKPKTLLEAAEYFIENININLPPEQIVEEINLMIEEKYKFHFNAKEGVLDFLENNKHLKMCVATATDKHLVEHALKRLEIDEYFDFIITSREVGNGKQNPDIFLNAAEKLGLAIDEVVVFEDALHAIVTAKSAGFYTVGVYETAFANDHEEIKQIADCFIDNLNSFEL
ncbi:MAG TPA: thiamine phosphate synthase [Desulfitobacteriaceae bacterium]|nr:thiamine phosphate synthase [Desulfitobacteriaceae bacterium]